MAKENQQEELGTTEDVSTSSLQDFNWDETEDFFGIKPDKSETEEVIKKVKTDDLNDEPTLEDDDLEEDENTKDKSDKPKKGDEADKEDSFFEEQPAKDESLEKEKSTETEEPSDDSKFYSTLASELKEKGIFQNVELKEGEEIDEDKFFELQDAEIESRVEETFEAFFEELDEDAKAFLKFKKSGGNTQDFFQVYRESLSLDNIDLESEESQELVLKHYLSTMDSMDDEEISDRLEWLKENGKKKAYAKKYMNKLQELDRQKKEAISKSIEAQSKQREEGAKKFNQDLQSELEKTEAVGSFNFSKVNKKELLDFMVKPSVKIGKNKYITHFQAELGNIFKAEGEDKKKLLLLAKLVKSNFDVKDLIEETKTKVVKEAKSKLQQAKSGVKPSTSGGYTKKSISDYF
jgi:hypothetical protein